MTQKHTPLPWPEFKENGAPQWDENFSFEEADDPTEYKSFVRMMLDDYNFSRHACNSHYELLEALKGVQENPESGAHWKAASAAIAKAEGK